MPLITIETLINAPMERVFDLARSIDAHMASTDGTEERAVAGRTTGLIGRGESVTWEARHFGIRQRLTAHITAFDRPHLSRLQAHQAGAEGHSGHVHPLQRADGAGRQRGGPANTWDQEQ